MHIIPAILRMLTKVAPAQDLRSFSPPPPVISRNNSSLLDLPSTLLSKFILIPLVFLLLPALPAYAATITVGTGCTLANAINEANGVTINVGTTCGAGTDGAGATGADTIVIPASNNITLTADLPVISSTIRINGNSNTISGNDARRIIQVGSGGDLTIDNWILTNGACNDSDSCHGGAIYVYRSKLTLQDSTVKNSKAGDAAQSYHGSGGGIYALGAASAQATLSITNSSIYSNSATDNGGGIALNGKVNFTMTGSSAYTNAAGNTPNLWNGSGGGIYANGTAANASATVRISTSSIYNNRALVFGGGGGISVNGFFDFTMARSAVYSNTSGGGINVGGGGLSIKSAAETGKTTALISNSSIFKNIGRGRGGGIYASYNASNTASSLTVTHATITGNTSHETESSNGGGVYVKNVALSLRNSIISGNTNQNCQLTSGVTVSALTNNIIGSGSSATCAASQLTSDPRLVSPTTGSPPYYKFYADSPALNAAGDCTSLTTVDQAGTTRPVGAACDIGAYEGAGETLPVTATATATATQAQNVVIQNNPTATATATQRPLVQQSVGGQSPDDDDGDGGEDGENSLDQAFVAFPTWTTTPFFRYSPAQSCLTLQPDIVINNASSGTSCQRVQGMQIGHPDVAAALPSLVVDIWGWVTPNTEVCFRASSGAIKFIDTTALPRTVADLPVHNQPGGLLCALINGAGQVALVAGPPAPYASATPPAYRSLSGCMVRTQYILNLRGSPGGETLLHVPFNVMLTALEKSGNWYKVDYLGEHGWLSGDYVEPEGNCG